MKAESLEHLFADKPLADPAGDALGRKPLAESLAKGLLRMAADESYVVAVFGPWGSGKSTLLGFMKYFLNLTPAPDSPIVVEFNPWWFSGREDLTISFFNQLSVAIDDGTSQSEEIRTMIADCAEIVSHYPHWTAKVGGVLAKWFAGQKKSVPKLKTELGKRLLKYGRRIVVMIDDVDRLMPGEILDMFRLVKAVADLPNMLYVLAFERRVVADAITSTLGSPIESFGNSYLEKIIQIPVELPIPDQSSIRDMFASQIGGILGEQSMNLFDRDYWRDVYMEGIDRFLDTPRDVGRFVNALRLTLPMVEGEVNPVDFIALEALRIFRPAVYDQIRFHPEQFSGPTPRKKQDDVTKFHTDWMTKLKEDQEGAAAKILVRIFPKFESSFRNIEYDSVQDWRLNLRACSPDKLPVYFCLALPTGDISRSELDSLVSKSADPKLFAEALISLTNQKRPDGRTRVWQALEMLGDSKASIFPEDKVASAIEGLAATGDELMQIKDMAGFLGIITNKDRIVRLVFLLLWRLDLTQRVSAIRNVVDAETGLSLAVEIIAALGQEHGKYSGESSPEELRLLNISDVENLEQIVAKKIACAAEVGDLATTPEFVHVLYRWRDWGEKTLVANWLEGYLKEDSNFLSFLNKLIPDDAIGSGKDPVSSLKSRRYLSAVQDFIKIEDYADHLHRLSSRDDLTENDKIRLRLLCLHEKEE